MYDWAIYVRLPPAIQISIEWLFDVDVYDNVANEKKIVVAQ